MTAAQPTPITADSVVEFLATRGIVTGGRPTVSAMTGGVSCTVLLVEAGDLRLVVKQALDQLLVEGDWFATPERAVTEAAALSMLRSLTPDYVPELVDASPADHALVMTAAPADWRTWKARLLADEFDGEHERAAASVLGTVLANWHTATAGDRSIAARFDDYEAFEQLRIAPFHRTVLARHPVWADSIRRCIDDLIEHHECFVHGDFSPKNILVNPRHPTELWVLDFEVGHYGAAVFDLAFLHCHLLLKAIHRPEHAAAMAQIASAFQGAYGAGVSAGAGSRAVAPFRRLGWQTACLMLARVDGTSPAGYLTAGQQDRVRNLAGRILGTPDRPIDEVWALLTEELDE